MIAQGLWLRKFTAWEPDDDQFEVALTALKRALKIDKYILQHVA